MKTLAVACLLLCAGASAADFPLACLYVAEGSDAGLERHAGCAARRGTEIRIADEHLSRMAFAANGLASIAVDGSWYYAKRSGQTLRVVTYDNGPDYFAEGLVRSVIGGKIAYFDTTFSEVIPPTYDSGWPFHAGRALVCSGCAPGAPDADGHVPIVGGRWGYIDRRGHEVVPVALTASEARAR